MKSLLKHLSPFAPDQSGAVSALFEFGGLIAICDAGGCTGNICGFDEPRWFTRRSAIFSAGLRDMDAILGRDDKLVAKLQTAMDGTGLAFSAIIGTPVPAIIATDFKALKRMAEKRTGRPAITVATTGTRHYDRGASDAWLELFKTFATERIDIDSGIVGVLGASPLDFPTLDAGNLLSAALKKDGWKMINGRWYYFRKSGYAAQNEFVKGRWIGSNCAWADPVKYSWHKTAQGWWYGASGGWYAKNKTYVIDGKSYSFDKLGYMK